MCFKRIKKLLHTKQKIVVRGKDDNKEKHDDLKYKYKYHILPGRNKIKSVLYPTLILILDYRKIQEHTEVFT